METLELISKYKTQYTPMDSESELLTYYKRRNFETGSFEPNPIEVHAIVKQSPYTNIFNTISQYKVENQNRQLIKLSTELRSQWNEKKEWFKEISFDFFKKNSLQVFQSLIELNPEYIKFNLSTDYSIFIQSRLQNKNIYLEIFFDSEDINNVEVVCNIYENTECILAYGGETEKVFNQLNSIFKSFAYSYKATPQVYDISQPAFTWGEL